MQVKQAEVANNWVLILNFLLNPTNGYRINYPPQLNSDNFQGSFGRQVFIYSSNRNIVQTQIRAMQRYQQGLYYQVLLLFIKSLNEEYRHYGRGNPEILIYINNCLIEDEKASLQQRGIKVYTLAVVGPFHHNQGRITIEILREIAQIQSVVNFHNFNIANLESELCGSTKSNKDGRLNQTIFSIFGRINPNSFGRMALQIMVVNDPNIVYAPYNQTAEKLASLAAQIELTGVIGHYSSEMTQMALNFYAEKGIVLINASSTSNDLSRLGESIGFFRLTTQDSINAAQLLQYLAKNLGDVHSRSVAIIYNENSSYSCSYRSAIIDSLEQHQPKFRIESQYGKLGGEFQEIQIYLNTIQDSVDVIILIPDGGIEPN